MTPSQSLAFRIVKSPTKVVGFMVRAAWAAIVLLAVSLLWLLLFLVFLPFLLLSLAAGWKITPPEETEGRNQNDELVHSTPGGEDGTALIFDRRRDISKIFGCNTRNVNYRWQLFSKRLKALKTRFPKPRALDFGAGSLRDSFELIRQGCEVASVDLDEEILQRYFASYDWSSNSSSPRLVTRGLKTLLAEEAHSFHLAIAFDVIEHLENPSDYLRQFHKLLHRDGFLFSILPNKRSVFETYFRRILKKQRLKGVVLAPGVPHLQFRTPDEWAEFFESNGFRIVEHDMAIGFLVNDCWNGLLGLPIRVYVSPVLAVLANALHIRFDAAAFETAFSPAWLMKRVAVLDELLKRQTAHRSGWNLIVAQPKEI